MPGEKSYIFNKNTQGIVNVSDKQIEEINTLSKNMGLLYKIKSVL